MGVHRMFTVLAAAMLVASLATPSAAQSKPAQEEPEKLKLSRDEMSQFKTLTTLVDNVASGKEPAPADLKVTFNSHFIRSEKNIFVPYVLEIGGGKFSAFPVALYVRAVAKGAAANTGTEPAFTDIFFANENAFTKGAQDTVQLMRAVELPPGDFDIIFALSEAPPRKGNATPKRVVHTQPITVPDLLSGLTTSSIILARNLEEAPQQLTARQQMEQPFTIGGQKITPNFAATFAKSAELLFLFLIYNEGTTANGKPDLEVAYTMTRGDEPKPFAKMPSSTFNASTLPAEFSVAAGHQVMVAQGVPLATFAPGPYKLGISITDKTSNQTIQRTVPFTVTD